MRDPKSYLDTLQVETMISWALGAPQSYLDALSLLSSIPWAHEVPQSYLALLLPLSVLAGMALQDSLDSFLEGETEAHNEGRTEPATETSSNPDDTDSESEVLGNIYARVSSPKQVKSGNSLKEQVKKLKQIADERNIELVDDPIMDGGKTGTDFDRPGIRELTNLATAGKIDIVLVDDVDRLGRHAAETMFYVYELREECGVTILTIEDGELDVKVFGDLVQVMLKTLSSQMANENRARRAYTACVEKFKRKNWSVFFESAPLGYDLTGDDWLTVNLEQQETVQEIFEVFLSVDIKGAYRRTAERASGIADSMESGRLKRILQNQVYIGEPTVGSAVSEDGESSAVSVTDEDLQIIDEEDFDQAQGKIEQVADRYSKGSTSPDDVDNLVQEFGIRAIAESSPIVSISCPACGGKLVKNGQRSLTNRKVHNYQCNDCGKQRKFPTEKELVKMSKTDGH